MFDPLHKWLGIPPHEQPPHHYRLLGIATFEDDTDVIDAAADKQLAFLHGLTNGEYAELAEQLSNQVSAARLCLLNSQQKSAYDETLRRQLERFNPSITPPTLQPAFEVSEPKSAVAASASPTVRVRRKQASKRPPSPAQWFMRISTLLCIVALVLIGIVLAQGRISLDLSALKIIGIAGPAKPEPRFNAEVVAPKTSQTHAPTPAQPRPPEPVRADPTNVNQPRVSPSPPPRDAPVDPQPSRTPPRSLADLVHGGRTAEDSKPIVKAPLPTESQLEEKMQLIRELYQNEYRNAKTSAEKIELAQLMHREGQNTIDDPIGRFALWRVSRDIMTREGDFQSALGIVDNLDTHYRDVDANPLRVETLRATANQVTDSSVSDFLDAFASVVSRCRKNEEYELAKSLCAFVVQELDSRVTGPRRSELELTTAETQFMEDSFQRYKAALRTLDNSQDDPEANQAVGHYLCLIHGEWEAGLEYLSRGSDLAIRSAVDLERANPSDASQAIAVADAWYDIAEGETGSIERATIRRHAFDWYRKARDGATGLELKKVDLRIASLEKLFPSSDGGVPGYSSPKKVLGYRLKNSLESRSDFANRSGNDFTLGMGPRPDGRGEAEAGIELQGVEIITVVGSASHDVIPEVDPYSKVGFVIDYHTPGGYAKRVFLGLGLPPGRQFTDAPLWGTAKVPDITTDIGRATAYEIDLRRWAPSTWDGRCWFTISMQNAGADRTLNATVSW